MHTASLETENKPNSASIIMERRLYMTNREYVNSLDNQDFAHWIFDRVYHWPGMDGLLEWLDTERND